MTEALEVPAWVAAVTVGGLFVLAVAVVALLVAVRRARGRTERLIGSAAADAEALRAQLAALEADLERRLAAAPAGQVGSDRQYLITAIGEDAGAHPGPAAPTVPAPVFADIVLRESVVRTASLAAGLRRALSSEVRHRIRAEMRREVKRARKQRRSDVRQARRDWHARQRSGVPVPETTP